MQQGKPGGVARATKTLIRAASRFQWGEVILTCRSRFEQLMFGGDERQTCHPSAIRDSRARNSTPKRAPLISTIPASGGASTGRGDFTPANVEVGPELSRILTGIQEEGGLWHCFGPEVDDVHIRTFCRRCGCRHPGSIEFARQVLLADLEGCRRCPRLVVRNEREWATKDELLQLLSPPSSNSTVTQRRQVLTQMLAAGVLLEVAVRPGLHGRLLFGCRPQRFSDHLVARHLLDRHLPEPVDATCDSGSSSERCPPRAALRQ